MAAADCRPIDGFEGPTAPGHTSFELCDAGDCEAPILVGAETAAIGIGGVAWSWVWRWSCLAIDAVGADDAADGAIVTTAPWFAAAAAAIPRGFVNGMTLGGVPAAGPEGADRWAIGAGDPARTGVTNEGNWPSETRRARASNAGALSARWACGLARAAREESRRLVELMERVRVQCKRSATDRRLDRSRRATIPEPG